MKVIISSKSLAEKLNALNLEEYNIHEVIFKDNYLYLKTPPCDVEIYCESNENEKYIKQESQRWDWVKKLMNQVDEQPVVLDINEYRVSVRFDY